MKTYLSTIIALAAVASTATATTVVDPSLASYDSTAAISQPAANTPAIELERTSERNACGLSFDVNVGTQGVGMSLGYEFNEYIKMRIRGAYMDLSYNDTWGDGDGEVCYDGSNAGIILDYHPFGGSFHLSAGLNFSKSTLTATATTTHNLEGTYNLGGYTFEVVGNDASIKGEYDWRDLQPYVGIGWSTDGDGDRSLYFTFDIGVNFIGSGKFSINTINGIANVKGPNGEDLGHVTQKIAEQAVREEGKDFFKIADDIFVYPVIQLGLGYRF